MDRTCSAKPVVRDGVGRLWGSAPRRSRNLPYFQSLTACGVLVARERHLRPGADDDDWSEPQPELHAGPRPAPGRPHWCPER